MVRKLGTRGVRYTGSRRVPFRIDLAVEPTPCIDMSGHSIHEALSAVHWYQVAAAGVLFFAFIYLVFGALTWAMTRRVLPVFGHGGRLDPRMPHAGQFRRELLLSASSVVLFGTGLLLPWGLFMAGWTDVATDPSLLRTGVEIVALVLWNEVHFYAMHRLLHVPRLSVFHLPHHRSVVTTPWATYSFHPVEAALLGPVIIPPMLVHDFSAIALLALPLLSLLFNNIGHSNYDFLPDAERDRWWLNGGRRHHLHHACFHGNYGFMFPFMDRLCGTELAANAAAARIRHAA